MRYRRPHAVKLFFIELISVFLGVSLAFALNQWNENKKADETELKLIQEMKSGLQADIEDIELNSNGHQRGIAACQLFRRAILGKPVDKDSLGVAYAVLWRNYISIQNRGPFEALKARGLNQIREDSIRKAVINLYDFQYEILEEIEENYAEMQFFENYFPEMQEILLPYLEFDKEGNYAGIKERWWLRKSEKTKMLSYINRMQFNRQYVLMVYDETAVKAKKLISLLDEKLNTTD